MTTVAPFGSWRSPITSELITSAIVQLGAPQLIRGDLYWLEGRPTEGGRSVIVRARQGQAPADVTPAGFNVRSRVHEYGGGAWLVDGDTVYFTNFTDQQLWRQSEGEAPVPLTHEPAMRFADAVIDPRGQRLVCVAEDHANPDAEPENRLVAVDLESGAVTTLHAGRDFYAAPTWHPAGDALVYLCWDHPDMPWDNAELWISAGGVTRHLAGGAGESIVQPRFSAAGQLGYVSDRNGFWNLHTIDHTNPDAQADNVCPLDAEFASPLWALGQSTWDWEDEQHAICRYAIANVDHVGRIDLRARRLTDIEQPFTDIAGISVEEAEIALTGATPTALPALCRLTLATGEHQIIKRASTATPPMRYLSEPEAVSWETGGGETAHGFLYRPVNIDFAGPDEERPPLLVTIHGGPTSAAHTGLSYGVQYWTSRGIAVLDVNYRGSSGYGRAYRDKLRRAWGVADVEDVATGAAWAAAQGAADPARLLIRGGSAGGFTTLAALTFKDTFCAGASHYGIGDLAALATDTHKFESRYLDSLIGAWPAEQARYEALSPIHHVDQLDRPVIFFQGLEDRVVPPGQAEAMVAALRDKGVPVAYVPFEGEQHGFRIAANIKRALDLELWFYGRLLGFSPADPVAGVPIDNLDDDTGGDG